MNVRKILMPTDFSPCAHAALDHAIFLAKQHDAELTLLHVLVLREEDPFDPAHHFPDGEELFARLKKVAGSELQGLLDQNASFATLNVREAMVRGVAPAPEIVSYADDHRSDLIVLGTHGRRGLRHFLLGSVAEEVVRLAPCPVLTVRGSDGEGASLHAPFDVVVPYDFSPAADASLATARELAARYRSRIHLIHVIQPPMDPERYDPLHDPRLSYNLGDLKIEIENRLVEVLEEAGGPRVPAKIVVEGGAAASAIARYAEEHDAGLIVIATHGLRGVERFFLGSVTEKVVRLAKTPVLTLRAVEERARNVVAA